MAETTTVTPTSSIEPGKYTKDKLFLKLDTTEFNSHKNDINANGQIAFVDNGDSSYIYAQGIKVGGTDINVDDLNLSDYATKSHVTNTINALDVTDAAVAGKYVSAVSEANGKITVNRADLPTLSSLGGITSSSVDTKISNAINALDVSDTAVAGKYVSAVSEANGKITVTRASLPTAQTVSINSSKNSIDVNGVKYTLGISTTGELSLSPYAKTTLGNLSLSTINYTNKASESTSKYVGTTYTISVGIDITSTTQTLTIPVSNTTGNKYKIAIKESTGNSYLRNDTSYSLSTNGNITETIGSAYIMSDVQTQTWSSKPVTWAASTPLEVNTTGERTFTVYLTEEGKPTISKTVTQLNIQSKCTITAKVPVAAITSSSTAVSLKDVNYSTSISIGKLTCDWKVASNTAPTFYIPACLSKTPIIYDENNFIITSGFTVTTSSKTVCGCTTSFKIYTMNNKPSSDSKFTIEL